VYSFSPATSVFHCRLTSPAAWLAVPWILSGCLLQIDDGYLPPGEEEMREHVARIVEDQRATLGPIEAVADCPIVNGDLPPPDSDGSYSSWYPMAVVTQNVEASWGPELVQGTIRTLMEVPNGLAGGPNVGDRGFIYALKLPHANLEFSCSVDPATTRVRSGDYGFGGTGSVSLDQMAQFFDEAVPGDTLGTADARDMARLSLHAAE
jgi:hypothetical protein